MKKDWLRLIIACRYCNRSIFMVLLMGLVYSTTYAAISPFDYNGLLFDDYQSFPINYQRDSTDSRGPVVFPNTPIGGETSGVRVGASGYGFVPPGRSGRVAGGPIRGGAPHYFDDVLYWR